MAQSRLSLSEFGDLIHAAYDAGGAYVDAVRAQQIAWGAARRVRGEAQAPLVAEYERALETAATAWSTFAALVSQLDAAGCIVRSAGIVASIRARADAAMADAANVSIRAIRDAEGHARNEDHGFDQAPGWAFVGGLVNGLVGGELLGGTEPGGIA